MVNHDRGLYNKQLSINIEPQLQATASCFFSAVISDNTINKRSLKNFTDAATAATVG